MRDQPETHPSLLVRLRERTDDDAWSQFVAVYTPVIYQFLRQRGLQDADASDLTQDVLAAVVGAIRDFHYSTGRGSFRGWLFTIVQNRLRNFRRDAPRRVRGTGDTSAQTRLNEQPDVDDGQAQWDLLYERRLFHHAADRVRERYQDSTWQAFWRTAVDGRPAGLVAAELGLTPAAVYLARGRVTAGIREQVRLLTAEEP
jgi:RNA polymerase sigma-70 factor (ECF subfamily)